jgi:hypothetical protein
MQIASAYGVTRQRLHQICEAYALTNSDFREPDRVFERLLEGYASPLRRRLADYTFRQSIRQTLSTANQ